MSSIYSGQNQRNFPRLPKAVPVTISKLEYPFIAAEDQSGQLKNIAEGGICFTSVTGYEPGTRLSLKITLKGWRRHLKSVTAILDDTAATTATAPLTAIAEVTWISPLPNGNGYEIGVKFLDIYEDEYRALRKYLENLADYSTAG